MTVTATRTPIKVFIVDDHTIVRQGLRRLLESEKGLTVVGEAKDGLEAVQRSADVDADVILMDLSMPSLGGVDATRRILKAKPGARVIVLSMYADPDFAEQALRAGVAGYVTKDAPAEELLGAVRAVAGGEAYFTERLGPLAERAEALAKAAPRGEREGIRGRSLTEREREVLTLLAEGLSVKETAVKLGISPKTADVHKTKLMKKLAIHNRVDLVKYAIHKRMIVI